MPVSGGRHRAHRRRAAIVEQYPFDPSKSGYSSSQRSCEGSAMWEAHIRGRYTTAHRAALVPEPLSRGHPFYWPRGVAVKASVQNHVPERSEVIVTRVKYGSPESGFYQILKQGSVHKCADAISVTRSVFSMSDKRVGAKQSWLNCRVARRCRFTWPICRHPVDVTGGAFSPAVNSCVTA